MKEEKNCICQYYTSKGIRKGTVKRLIGKPYCNTTRRFQIGCPIHDKSFKQLTTSI